MDQFNETKKLYAMRETMPLAQKICLSSGIKMRNHEMIFGMTPEDYNIYRDLDKIDHYGEFKNLNFNDKSLDSDSGEIYLSNDEKAEIWIKKIQQKCIINH
jgi:uncharacterized protein (UPF0332 family)